MMNRLRILILSLSAVVVLVGAQPVWACPTCKDSLTENYIQAYGISIIFMMSMPFIIFGSLSVYFYYEVCKARKQQQAEKSMASGADDRLPAASG